MIKVIIAKNCEYFINKQKHQIVKKFLRQFQGFSTRLNYSIKKSREIYVNIAYLSLGNVIDKLQLKFYKSFQSNKIYHEVLLLMEFLQTKPDVKNMNINYTDLYYTVIKTRDENQNIDIQFESDYHDYIDINYFFMPLNYTPSHKTILM